MRTQDEIVKKIHDLKDDDFFGYKRSDLIDFLDFEHAKEFLKPEAVELEWNEHRSEPVDEVIIEQIKKYMPFAWDKANNCRGLSASRSIEHMEAWLWLLNDARLQDDFDAMEYEHYGKEKLIVICQHLKFDWEALDDGVRTNTDS